MLPIKWVPYVRTSWTISWFYPADMKSTSALRSRQMMSEKCRFTCRVQLSRFVWLSHFLFTAMRRCFAMATGIPYLSIHLSFLAHITSSGGGFLLLYNIFIVSSTGNNHLHVLIYFDKWNYLHCVRCSTSRPSCRGRTARRVKFILDFIYRFNISCTLSVACRA